jgi:hypothetical protein
VELVSRNYLALQALGEGSFFKMIWFLSCGGLYSSTSKVSVNPTTTEKYIIDRSTLNLNHATKLISNGIKAK